MSFTEHQDLDFPPGEFDFLVDMDAYQQTLSTLAKKYQEQIHIRFGIELGLQPQLENQLSDFVNSYPIGSSTPTLACHHSSYLYSLFYVDCN